MYNFHFTDKEIKVQRVQESPCTVPEGESESHTFQYRAKKTIQKKTKRDTKKEKKDTERERERARGMTSQVLQREKCIKYKEKYYKQIDSETHTEPRAECQKQTLKNKDCVEVDPVGPGSNVLSLND